MVINGKITKITELDPYGTGHQKRLAKIEAINGRTKMWIEFSGFALALLDRFKVSDMVSVEWESNAQENHTPVKSYYHTNIIAKHIQQLELITS